MTLKFQCPPELIEQVMKLAHTVITLGCSNIEASTAVIQFLKQAAPLFTPELLERFVMDSLNFIYVPDYDPSGREWMSFYSYVYGFHCCLDLMIFISIGL